MHFILKLVVEANAPDDVCIGMCLVLDEGSCKLSDEGSGDERWLESLALRQALDKLNERERTIIDMRYFGNRTQTEIASHIGISQAQVSRLEKGALEKMRRQMV